MTENRVALETNGIKRALKGFDIYDSIIEFIWNGFDAKAKRVEINFVKNQIGVIDRIDIIDDGEGINKEKLYLQFKPVYDSNKIKDRKDNIKNTSQIHGKNGVGRLTFFSFAGEAIWNTVYEINSVFYKYSIIINSDSLDKYSENETETVNEKTGTTVSFHNLSLEKFNIEELLQKLRLEFSWYLELNNYHNYSLIIDGIPLDYSSIIHKIEKINYFFEEKNIDYSVKYVIWKVKLRDEYSKYYYLDQQYNEIYKDTTTLNNKGDKFYHSVFIQSPIFGNFKFNSEETDENATIFGYTKSSPEYLFIMEKIEFQLRKLRNPFIEEYAKDYIDELKCNGAYPELSKESLLDQCREKMLDNMVSVIYYAEPRIFAQLNKIQQKTLIRLLDLSMQSGEIDNLYSILSDVVDMSTSERVELAELLKYTNLSHITKTITVIKDRLEVIQELKNLVFDNEEYSTEKNHIQPFIERNYWLFGEQYYLVTAEEPDFEEALRRFLFLSKGEKKKKKEVHIDDENKNKEMDIFAVRRKLNDDIKECIVVELKRPSITIKSKELQQVKDYCNVIDNESRFNAPNIDWVFYLVGNNYNREIINEFENSKNHGERSLAYKVNNKKIYVKKWSEIFTEHELNLNFLKEKLEMNQLELNKKISNMTPEEIVQSSNSAIMPPEIILSD